MQGEPGEVENAPGPTCRKLGSPAARRVLEEWRARDEVELRRDPQRLLAKLVKNFSAEQATSALEHLIARGLLEQAAVRGGA